MQCKHCGGTNLMPDLKGEFYDATNKGGQPFFCDDCHPGYPLRKIEELLAENKRLKEALESIKDSSWDAQTSRLIAQQALQKP